MGTVVVFTLAFIVVSYLLKKITEKLVFLSKSNWKYLLIDYLSDYIHYGEDIGVDASLALDSPSREVFLRRKEGQNYLQSKLVPSDPSKDQQKCGQDLSLKLVDCRFRLAKVCMPLMRELEFPATRNFLTELRNRKQSKSQKGGLEEGMLEVDSETASNLLYVGNDAVHTLGIKAFHEPVQEEISKQMSLLKDRSSFMRFAPLSLNPILEENVNMILELTGMDQVRYSLSGSEAMDAALKDIKSSCRNKTIIVRFSSAYHGHVSGVDYLNSKDHIYLKECCKESIQFIEKYHHRIAAVIVNPMQHFTGINKASPPGEKLTISSRVRSSVSKNDYAKWLHDLQNMCNYCTSYLTKVAFVIDDIYFAFRTPELFSKDYFTHPETGASLQPNVMVLGKAVAAGYPLSMVLGQKGYLNTYDKKFLLQVNKTVGTLSAWHGGIVASNIFLQTMLGKNNFVNIDPKLQLQKMVLKFDTFSKDLNGKFTSNDLPLRIRNFSNTFSIDFLEKSLYNSRYPQYLMAEGLYLGNYSTGKFNLTNDCTLEDLELLGQKFIAAGLKMKAHGYFEPISKTSKHALVLRLGWKFFKTNIIRYYHQIMEDKHIDIQVSHNHPVNKFGHLWSSVFMILFAYPYLFIKRDTIKGCLWFFATHVIRQSGHFFYEHQDRDIEKRKFGHKDKSKKQAVAGLLFAVIFYHYRQEIYDYLSRYVEIPSLSLDQYIALVCLFTIVPHFVEILHQYGFLRALSWMLKIFTDPFTDLLDFYPNWIIHPKWFLNFKDHNAIYKLDITTASVSKVGIKKKKV